MSAAKGASIEMSSLWHPRSLTIASASALELGDDDAVGISTTVRRSAPIAAAVR
jgi:hypothetical protein